MSKTALFRSAAAWDPVGAGRALRARPVLACEVDRSGRTALEVCAGTDLRRRAERAADAVETARVLLEGGVPLDRVRMVDDDGESFPISALWYAVGYGHNLPLAQYLIGMGASPDWCLWAAVWNDDSTMVRLLVESGAPTELVVHAETPLVYAVRLGRLEVIPVLLAAGASATATDGKGRSLQQLARRAKLPADLVDLLAGDSKHT